MALNQSGILRLDLKSSSAGVNIHHSNLYVNLGFLLCRSSIGGNGL